VEDFADFVARHALILFGALFFVALGIVAALWRLLDRHGEVLWRFVARLWKGLKGSAPVRGLRHRWPRAMHLLAAPLRPGPYLALHLLIGGALCLMATLAFVELADEVADDGALAHFDRSLSAGLRHSLGVPILRGFYWVTHLGDPGALALIGGLVALWLGLWRRNALLTAAWIAAIAGNGLLVRLLKLWFHRDRPLHDHGLFVAHGWSFPSGHAAGALAVYGMLAYILVRTLPVPLRLPAVVLAIAMVLLVGTSRVFLQVHYFSDVMAGYAIALAWLSVCVAGAELAMRHRTRRQAAATAAPSS
jgi:membrane-associated phospholipid phosphatase